MEFRYEYNYYQWSVYHIFVTKKNSHKNYLLPAIELINEFNGVFHEIKVKIINRLCSINTILPRNPGLLDEPGFVIDFKKINFTFHTKGIIDQK